MDQTGSTNYNHGRSQEHSTLLKAERAVTDSLERFESAMEDLAVKVDESGRRVQHTVELVDKTKSDFMRIKDSVVSAVRPLGPYYRQLTDASGRLGSRVRQNPTPYAIAAVGFIGSLFLIGYLQRRNRTEMATATVVVVEPIAPPLY